MTYEAWRISYQSSEQAARAAYAECVRLQVKIAEMERQEPVGEVVEDDFCKVVKGINSWWLLPNGTKLYALHGAQGEGK